MSDGACAGEIPSRERLVDEHAATTWRPVGVVKVATGDYRNAKRFEESRTDGGRPEVRNQYRRRLRPDFGFGGPDTWRHPRQTVRKGHAANVRLACDATLEF